MRNGGEEPLDFKIWCLKGRETKRILYMHTGYVPEKSSRLTFDLKIKYAFMVS